MTTQAAEATGVETSTPTTNAFLLIAKIKPGQTDALRAAVLENEENFSDPEGALARSARYILFV